MSSVAQVAAEPPEFMAIGMDHLNAAITEGQRQCGGDSFGEMRMDGYHLPVQGAEQARCYGRVFFTTPVTAPPGFFYKRGFHFEKKTRLLTLFAFKEEREAVYGAVED